MVVRCWRGWTAVSPVGKCSLSADKAKDLCQIAIGRVYTRRGRCQAESSHVTLFCEYSSTVGISKCVDLCLWLLKNLSGMDLCFAWSTSVLQLLVFVGQHSSYVYSGEFLSVPLFLWDRITSSSIFSEGNSSSSALNNCKVWISQYLVLCMFVYPPYSEVYCFYRMMLWITKIQYFQVFDEDFYCRHF